MNKCFFSILSIVLSGSMFCQNKAMNLIVYSTAENSNQRLTVTERVAFSDMYSDADVSIFVNPAKIFQAIQIGRAHV